MIEIEIDGNDGTGKSTLINYLKLRFNQCIFKDRGLFSEYTMQEDLEGFRNIIKSSNKFYIILKSSIKKSQNRILKRGDSLEEEFHTKEDLLKYNKKFKHLSSLCKDLSNVFIIDTTFGGVNKMCYKASRFIYSIL